MNPEDRIRATMHNYAEKAMAGRDLWPQIARALRTDSPSVQPRREPAGSAGSPRRGLTLALAVAPLVLIGLLLWAGFGAVVTKLLPRQSSQPATQGTPIANWTPGPLVQSRDGFTMTLQPISADRNSVIISYTLSTAGGPVEVMYRPVLTTRQGENLPLWVSRSGHTGGSAAIWRPGSLIFDTQALTAAGNELQLDLQLPGAKVAQAAPTSGIIQLGAAVESTPTPAFHFQFAMPFDPRRRVADVNQTVERDGVRFTLDRAVVTPFETRLHFHNPDDDPPQGIGSLSGQPTLYVDSKFWDRGPDGKPREGSTMERWNPDGSWDYSYFGSLLAKDDHWIAHIQNVTRQTDNNGNTTDIPGTWTYEFTVPPLTTP